MYHLSRIFNKFSNINYKQINFYSKFQNKFATFPFLDKSTHSLSLSLFQASIVNFPRNEKFHSLQFYFSPILPRKRTSPPNPTNIRISQFHL